MAHCRQHDIDLETTEALLLHILEHQITMEERMTGFANDQAHLDDDVAKLTEAIGTAVTELKAQIGNGVPADLLDFSKLDSLVGTAQAEAAADAPAVQTPIVEAPVSNQQANTGQAPVEQPAGPPAATTVTEAPASGSWPESTPPA